jgi:hypothetical protein
MAVRPKVVLSLLAAAMLSLGSLPLATPSRADAFLVETTLDGDLATGAPPGSCRSDLAPFPPGGPCTLRAAIKEVNRLPGGPHTITLQAGTYSLTKAELLVVSSVTVTITGAGPDTTVIDATATLPVVLTGNFGANLTVTGETLRNSAGGPRVRNDATWR